jgi:hypothetical protein
MTDNHNQEIAMKTYITPALTVKGDIVDTTRMIIRGHGDTVDPLFFRNTAPGSVGFQL